MDLIILTVGLYTHMYIGFQGNSAILVSSTKAHFLLVFLHQCWTFPLKTRLLDLKHGGRTCSRLLLQPFYSVFKNSQALNLWLTPFKASERAKFMKHFSKKSWHVNYFSLWVSSKWCTFSWWVFCNEYAECRMQGGRERWDDLTQNCFTHLSTSHSWWGLSGPLTSLALKSHLPLPLIIVTQPTLSPVL